MFYKTDERKPTDESYFHLEVKMFNDVCVSVNTPRSLAAWMLIHYDEHQQYLDLPSVKMHDHNETAADDYLVTEMLRKNPCLNLLTDPKVVAMETWYNNESYCKLTNEIFSKRNSGELCFPPEVENVIRKARIFIASVLGVLDQEKLDFAERSFGFGPGSTSAISGFDVIASRKYACNLDATPRLLPFARKWVSQTMWNLGNPTFVCLPYSKLEFVPKDAKTDRPIGIEPHMNVFFQHGIGALIKRQLKLSGLDIANQADKNRSLIATAIIDKLSSIDLQSASDTIAYEVVRELFGDDWFHLLCLCRTDYTLVDGQVVPLEKFSSMGNGYTFEMETLMFWALARACGCSRSVAFGDDIIISQGFPTELLIECLKYLGFKTNTRKTFTEGMFYESCGTDWYEGRNIRPFHLKGFYENKTSAIIRVANKLRLYSHRRNVSFGCDIRFLKPWLSTIRRDKLAGRTGIPLRSGDDGLIRNFDEAVPTLHRRTRAQRLFQIEGINATVYRGTTVVHPKSIPWGNYIDVLRGFTAQQVMSDNETSYLTESNLNGAINKPRCVDPANIDVRALIKIERRPEVIRGRVVDFALRTQVIPIWVDLGPWI